MFCLRASWINLVWIWITFCKVNRVHTYWEENLTTHWPRDHVLARMILQDLIKQHTSKQINGKQWNIIFTVTKMHTWERMLNILSFSEVLVSVFLKFCYFSFSSWLCQLQTTCITFEQTSYISIHLFLCTFWDIA